MPAIEVRLYLGDVWVLPSHRGQGWAGTLLEAYSVALFAELDSVASQLTNVQPVAGQAHKLMVRLSVDYHSKAGQRAGKQIMRALKTRVRAWAKAHPAFAVSL